MVSFLPPDKATNNPGGKLNNVRTKAFRIGAKCGLREPSQARTQRVWTALIPC